MLLLKKVEEEKERQISELIRMGYDKNVLEKYNHIEVNEVYENMKFRKEGNNANH